MAELLTGQVLFKGNDRILTLLPNFTKIFLLKQLTDIDQLHRIMQLLGKPDAKLLEKVTPDVGISVVVEYTCVATVHAG